MLHTCGAVHGEAYELVGIRVQFSFVAAGQELRVAGDHPQWLLQIVGGYISKLLKVRIGSRQLLRPSSQFLLRALALCNVTHKCGKESAFYPTVSKR